MSDVKERMTRVLLIVLLLNFLNLFVRLNGQYYMKTIAGISGGSGTGEDSPASTDMLLGPAGMWSDTYGNLYVCMDLEYTVRKISSNGIISTIIGVRGASNFEGTSGLGLETVISGANSIYGDSNDNYLYFSDRYYFIWRYSLVTSIVSRYAGAIPADYGSSGDGGQATSARLYTPMGVFLSSVGILYFVDFGNDRIRMIDTSTGIINTFAGSNNGFSGDNGPATAAKLNNPQSVWGNSLGVIFITDSSNQRIRQVQGNIITTYAITYSPASLQTLELPADIKGDSNGNMYVTDSSSCYIRFIDYSTNIITFFAGTGTCVANSTSIHLARTSSLSNDGPSGIAVDSVGNIFMSEYSANFIRLFYFLELYSLNYPNYSTYYDTYDFTVTFSNYHAFSFEFPDN